MKFIFWIFYKDFVFPKETSLLSGELISMILQTRTLLLGYVNIHSLELESMK